MRGFVVIPILIIIVVLSVGLVGFYAYYNRSHQGDVANTSQIKSASPSAQISSPTPQTSISPSVSPTSSPVARKSTIPSNTTQTNKPVSTIAPTPTPSPPPFKIDSISPNVAKYNDLITINGTNMGNIAGKIIFYFNATSINATFAMWTDDQIRAYVPPGKGSMQIAIQKSDGTISNKLDFTSTASQPVMTYIYYEQIFINRDFDIPGSEFGADSGTVKITLGSDGSFVTNCPLTSWSDTDIHCMAPSTLVAGTEYGVQVMAADGRESSIRYLNAAN